MMNRQRLLKPYLRSAVEVAVRIDALISKIRDVQGPNMNTGKPCDVVLVSHGQ